MVVVINVGKVGCRFLPISTTIRITAITTEIFGLFTLGGNGCNQVLSPVLPGGKGLLFTLHPSWGFLDLKQYSIVVFFCLQINIIIFQYHYSIMGSVMSTQTTAEVSFK